MISFSGNKEPFKSLNVKCLKSFGLMFAMGSVLCLTACGGGGSSDGNPASTDPNSNRPPTTGTGDNSSGSGDNQPSELLVGQLIDSAIANVSYVTSSGQEGVTNENGEYQYKEGDTVSFKLSGIEFPEIEANEVITPLELFSTDDRKDPQVLNFIRFIQTLDSDQSPETGIKIEDDVLNVLNDLSFTLESFQLSVEAFDDLAELDQLFEAQVIPVNEMVSLDDALVHFEDSLSKFWLGDSDGDGIPDAKDDDDDGDGVQDIFDIHPLDMNDLDGLRDFDQDGTPDSQDDDIDGDFYQKNTQDYLHVYNGRQSHLFAGSMMQVLFKINSDVTADELEQGGWQFTAKTVNTETSEVVDQDIQVMINPIFDAWEAWVPVGIQEGQFEIFLSLSCQNGLCADLGWDDVSLTDGRMLEENAFIQVNAETQEITIEKKLNYVVKCGFIDCVKDNNSNKKQEGKIAEKNVISRPQIVKMNDDKLLVAYESHSDDFLGTIFSIGSSDGKEWNESNQMWVVSMFELISPSEGGYWAFFNLCGNSTGAYGHCIARSEDGLVWEFESIDVQSLIPQECSDFSLGFHNQLVSFFDLIEVEAGTFELIYSTRCAMSDSSELKVVQTTDFKQWTQPVVLNARSNDDFGVDNVVPFDLLTKDHLGQRYILGAGGQLHLHSGGNAWNEMAKFSNGGVNTLEIANFLSVENESRLYSHDPVFGDLFVSRITENSISDPQSIYESTSLMDTTFLNVISGDNGEIGLLHVNNHGINETLNFQWVKP